MPRAAQPLGARAHPARALARAPEPLAPGTAARGAPGAPRAAAAGALRRLAQWFLDDPRVFVVPGPNIYMRTRFDNQHKEVVRFSD